VRFPSNRNVGNVFPSSPLPTGNLSVDTALRALFQDRLRLRNMVGVVCAPSDDLVNMFRACNDGDTILLLPGIYDAYSTITVDRSINILGLGATIRGEGLLLDLQADQCEIRNVGFERTTRVAAGPTSSAVLVSGNAALVDGCVISTPGPRGLQVDGDYCSAQNNRFLENASRVAGDSDVYWADGAIWGTACGNMWSRTVGSFVLDYRWVDNLTESANGNAGIVNVR
jgi:hypothetical protein